MVSPAIPPSTVYATMTLPGLRFGSSPLCSGVCPPGFLQLESASRDADGKRPGFGEACMAGVKVYCCPA
jgi:hypothetical protein